MNTFWSRKNGSTRHYREPKVEGKKVPHKQQKRLNHYKINVRFNE